MSHVAEDATERALDGPREGAPVEPSSAVDGPAHSRPPALVHALTVAVVIALVLLFFACALAALRFRHEGELCSNHLKQIALGAIQYTDDKRFFPHAGKITQLDGDHTTNDGPRSLRTLYYFNYLDAPETFVCPASPDVPAPAGSGFLGVTPTPGDRTAAHWMRPCPPLTELTELSYGWTRRGLTTRSTSGTYLAADRASEGRHRGARHITCVDGHTLVVKPGDPNEALLASCEPGGGGWLAVFPDDLPGPSPPDRIPSGERTPETIVLAASGAFLALACLLGTALAWRRRRRLEL